MSRALDSLLAGLQVEGDGGTVVGPTCVLSALMLLLLKSAALLDRGLVGDGW